MYQSAFHAIGGVKEIKVRQRMAHFADDFEGNRLRFGAAKQSVQFLTDIPRYVLEVMFYIGIALLTVIVYQTSNSEQVVGELALFVAAGSTSCRASSGCWPRSTRSGPVGGGSTW